MTGQAKAMQFPCRFRAGRGSDHALIYSSWMESERVRFPNSALPKREFCARTRTSIDGVLARAAVTIAHDVDDTDHIYGYLVHETIPLAWQQRQEESPSTALVLHFLYLKGVYRRRGFALRLVQHAIPEFGKRSVFTTAITHYRQPTLRDGKGEPIGVIEGEEHRQTWHATAEANRLVLQPLFLFPPATRAKPEAA